MSIELKIEALTAAITALTATIAAYGTGPLPSVAVRLSPVAPPAPVDSPVVQTPPVAPVVPAALAASAPFTDGKGLIDYVMAVYRAVGPAKGQQIQGILTGMGYANINDVKPEHYGEFHAKVEALR
jgi:hypothetical protein